MHNPPRAGWTVARRQPKVLLTLLLALPCNVHPSAPSGAEQFAQPPPLPSRPESGSSRQLQVTTGGQIRGGTTVDGSPDSMGEITHNTSTKWRQIYRRNQQKKFSGLG
eukprot:TRINITY_DN16236_c0_g1_i1.p1 TRINITY_DN16236_c0_g1~~TRINITY_DN16236_c0_g1_i1.p1  ORF type:complete len:108 (-),score=10.01 TRINITY_DN16236_c0_g1_i1:166-489(-)